VHRGLDRLDPTVLEILRLGAYQLLYMGGVPDYAAVSASVDQVRARLGPAPAGLVNAVLRKVADAGDGPERFTRPGDDAATFLSTWGSHPLWLVTRWLERWSEAEVRALVEANNRIPRVYLYGLDDPPVALIEALRAAGIEAEPAGGGSPCVRLGAGESPAAALAVVPAAIVQDPGAHEVVRYADVPLGTKVADLSAAPGGKILAASRRAESLLACDRSESRLHMLRENARRVGRAMAFAVADARQPPVDTVDVVLLDVPCTGTGTLARHPDARWRLRPESIPQMAALQAEMITAGAGVVARGGLLVYSTCTLEPEENEDVVHAFLSASPEFSIEATDAVRAELRTADGLLTVTPQATGFDGAFAARLRRAA